MNQGKGPMNSDYPVLRWISKKGGEPNKVITNDDYAVDSNYNYSKLLLDGNKLRNLSNVVP